MSLQQVANRINHAIMSLANKIEKYTYLPVLLIVKLHSLNKAAELVLDLTRENRNLKTKKKEDTMLPVIRTNSYFPSILDEFFNNFPTRSNNLGISLPKVNVVENENAWAIELAVPGLEKEDFKIEVKDDVLTVSNEKKEEHKEDGKNYMRREFSYCSFSRSFMLPELADSEKIDAVYRNGVLEVSIPKKEAEAKKDARVIDIR